MGDFKMITITNLTNETIDELKTLEKLSKYLPKYLKEKNVSYDVIIVDEVVDKLKTLGNEDILNHYSQFEQKYLSIGE